MFPSAVISIDHPNLRSYFRIWSDRLFGSVIYFDISLFVRILYVTRGTNYQSPDIGRESHLLSQFIITSISDDCWTLLLPT